MDTEDVRYIYISAFKNLRSWHLVPSLPWQIEVEKVKAVTHLFSWAPSSADCDCSYKIKRHSLLGRKAMANLDSVLKSITLPTEAHVLKAMVFPVVVYGCEI